MENIRDYIPANNLLTKFGGNDPWEFVYEVEKANMLKMMREVLDETQSEAGSEEGGSDEVKDIPGEEGLEVGGEESQEEELGSEGSVKQVRFSSNMPPVRNSRYADDEENVYNTPPAGSAQSVLRKGSATSSGFRKRQVTRLMSLQEDTREKEGVERISSRERGASLPVGSLQRQFESMEGGVAVGDVLLRYIHVVCCGCGWRMSVNMCG